ncbi:hypothetical protein F2981_17605 [Sinorhizobium meliloti]|nr:hypothetical protein [Sinorhizobium meliloti]
MEIDEKRDVWKPPSTMMTDEEESVRSRLAQALEANSRIFRSRRSAAGCRLDRQVAGGLAPVRAGRFVIHGSHDRDK